MRGFSKLVERELRKQLRGVDEQVQVTPSVGPVDTSGIERQIDGLDKTVRVRVKQTGDRIGLGLGQSTARAFTQVFTGSFGGALSTIA